MKKNVNIVNKKVKYEYEFIQTYICGVVLTGSEVKSIREGQVSLVDSYCVFINNELFLKNTNIKERNVDFGHNSNQDRKLLLTKKELSKLKKDLIKGYSIIPYRIFINDSGFIKIEIILGRGKKIHDKRQTLKLKDIQKELKNKLKCQK
jgi:SsrA-binding protein